MKTFAISIPKPCHEDWNKMTPDAKGAFCGSCQKSVHDFSNKTDEEIISVYEKEGEGKVCGRFAPAQLSRPVVSFGNVSTTNRLAVFLYALLLAFGATLFSGADAFGQEAVKGEMKVKVMGKMSVRPVEPLVANDTAKKARPVCGTTVKHDNMTMRLGQMVMRPIEVKDTVVKIMGDTSIEEVEDLKIIEHSPVYNIPVVPHDTIAIVETIPPIDTLEVIAPPENISFITGGMSLVEINEEAPLIPVPLTDEKTEDKPVTEVQTETVIESFLPIEDNLELTTTITPENVIVPPSDLQVKVSPNPNKGDITISYTLQNDMPVKIDLYDNSGKLIRTLTNMGKQYAGKYNVSYNIGDLQNGIYIATLLTNDRKSTVKIILSK